MRQAAPLPALIRHNPARGIMPRSALCERLLSAVRTIYLLVRTPEVSEQLRSIA
jgi:hypothetical protein